MFMCDYDVVHRNECEARKVKSFQGVIDMFISYADHSASMGFDASDI